jgi:hypothetical protein
MLALKYHPAPNLLPDVICEGNYHEEKLNRKELEQRFSVQSGLIAASLTTGKEN